MLNTDRVALPSTVEVRLKNNAAFVDNVHDFARDDLIGFKRPLARAFAILTPIVLAFVAHSYGWARLALWSAAYVGVAGAGLFLVGRQIWPRLVEEFERRSEAKRRAEADLRCGFGESTHLILRRAPFCVEYDGGVLVFADVGDFHTLYFDIAEGSDDPRWAYYSHGEVNRRVWRWLRLPVSREIVRFSAQGTRPGAPAPARRIETIDAFEAIQGALGEPVDGALMRMPLDDVIDLVDRRL